MPAKLRNLSGDDVVRTLATFGFAVVSQRGGYVKLRRVASDGRKQTLHLPRHGQLRRGTLHAIYQQAAAYIPETDLRPHFYSE